MNGLGEMRMPDRLSGSRVYLEEIAPENGV